MPPAPAGPEQMRVAAMMARRKTLNPNARTAAPGGAASPPIAAPKPAWQQLREQGVAGQGSAAANKAALAGVTTRSGPIMAPSDPMRPSGGMAPPPMTPEMFAQAKGGPMGAPPSGFKPDQPGVGGLDPSGGADMIANVRSGAKPWQGGDPAGGGQMSVENQDPGAGWSAQRMAGAMPGGGGFEGPGGGMPPGLGNLPPEIMQRLQAMRAPQQGGAPGMPPDPAAGRGFMPPGQGAPGAAPRPYGLQSFYGA